jgi:hypothetical protein
MCSALPNQGQGIIIYLYTWVYRLQEFEITTTTAFGFYYDPKTSQVHISSCVSLSISLIVLE